MSGLSNISLCVLRSGVQSMTSVSLVIKKVLSETIQFWFNKFVVNVSELLNIPPCVLRCGVRSTMNVSLVIGKVLSETVAS